MIFEFLHIRWCKKTSPLSGAIYMIPDDSLIRPHFMFGRGFDFVARWETIRSLILSL